MPGLSDVGQLSCQAGGRAVTLWTFKAGTILSHRPGVRETQPSLQRPTDCEWREFPAWTEEVTPLLDQMLFSIAYGEVSGPLAAVDADFR